MDGAMKRTRSHYPIRTSSGGYIRARSGEILRYNGYCCRSSRLMGAEKPMEFVLEAVDPATECIEIDARLHVDSVEELCKSLGKDATGFNPKLVYDLDSSDVERLRD